MNAWKDLKIFKLAVENASDHIIVTDSDGHILFANKAVTKITGYQPDEIIGKNPNLWGGQMPKVYYRKLWKRLKEDKKPYIGEIRNRRKDGEFYEAEVKIAPILDDRGNVKYLVGIERDITKLKQVERAKDEVISLTAHQLKNAPSTIKMFTDSLLDGIAGKLNKKQTQYISEIRDANKKNIDLINSLLNVTRLELGTFINKPELVDPKKAVKDVIGGLKYLIKEKELKIVEDYGEGLGPIMVSSESLDIVVHNLLSNACKYTPVGGRITISVAYVKRKLLFEVSDTGYGIPLADQPRIFTRMFRADNIKVSEPDGSGLGLYMVRLVLKGLKGSIRFKSEENKGTTFHVTFPVVGVSSGRLK